MPQNRALQLAIDTDPGLDDPASDEGHSVVRAGDESGEEIGADAERLIGQNHGRENSLAPLTADTGTDGGEQKSAIPMMPLGAPVPETAVPQALAAGDLPATELPETEPPETELPEPDPPEATQAPATGPAEPEAQEPDAAQSAAAAKEAADFLRVRSSPVPPEDGRHTRRPR